MVRNLSKIAFFILFVSARSTALFAVGQDSMKSSLSTENIVLLQTLWSESNNPAGLSFYNINNNIAQAGIYFNRKEGDYRRYHESNKQNQYGFYTNGYAALKQWKFYGEFAYYRQNDWGANWSDVLNPYNDNPYILGDKNTSRYRKEYFQMSTKGALQINSKLSAGFEINYQTGVGSRQKDPRPENKTTDFDIKPGIVYKLNNINLGVNFHFHTAKEDVEFNNVTDSLYSYYHLKGLGAFSVSQEEDERSDEVVLIGGGIQFGFDGNKIKNKTEVNFFQKENNIKRGKTYPLQVVLLEKFQTEITSSFLVNTTQNTINRFRIAYTNKRIYGHEPVVQPELIYESYQWSTVGKYILYWNKLNTFGADYSYYKLIDNNHINWGVTIGGKVTGIKTSYYFIPEKNEQELNYFEIDGLLEKEIVSGFSDLVFKLSGNYRKGFNSWHKLVDEETLLQTTNTQLVHQDFDYFNSRLLVFGVEIQFGRPVKIYGSNIQLFVNAAYNHEISEMNKDVRSNRISCRIGMNF
ncbi:MAG TPA: hypothetical protein VEP89_16345 [Draconibacterium sp.]|nr:hypothetical protein [Draconibacterium sp.]